MPLPRHAWLVVATLVVAVPLDASANEPPTPVIPPPVAVDDDEDKVDKERTEAAGIPVVAGSTDIGIAFGAAGSIAHVAPGVRPYVWKIDSQFSTSVKGGPNGLEFVQHAYDIRLDVPRGLFGKARLTTEAGYDRTINSGYFGLGNQAPVVTDKDGEVGRRYQFRHEEVHARINVRSRIDGPFHFANGLALRYVAPKAYTDSKLAIDDKSRNDDGTPLIYGLRPLGIAVVSSGLIYDSRDDEITPSQGAFHMFAMRFAGATPTSANVVWTGHNTTLKFYRRIGDSPFVFAGRVFVDLLAGHVPFYDLSQAGAFEPMDFPGGAEGIRGVPNGRYSGLVKAVGNAEMRVFYTSVRLLGNRFKIGNNVFFDAGRVWKNYTFSDDRDGSTLGLRFGAGAGFIVKVASAASFRAEFAYSPDASAANPGFPIGIYVAEGLMF